MTVLMGIIIIYMEIRMMVENLLLKGKMQSEINRHGIMAKWMKS